MKKYFYIIIGLAFFFLQAKGQTWKDNRYSIAGGIGATQFFGDIGGYTPGDNIAGIRDFSFRHTRINLSAGMRYRVLEDLTAKGSFTAGFLHATDINGSNPGRGFESNSFFLEPSVIGEYYILNKENAGVWKNSGAGISFGSLINLYAFTGVGGLWFKVDPNEALARRITQKTGFTPTIPLGIGLSFNFSNSFNLGAELGRKFLFSDNVDGYTSKFSKFNDVYYFLNFVVSYKLP
jgi:hypothetical protein